MAHPLRLLWPVRFVSLAQFDPCRRRGTSHAGDGDRTKTQNLVVQVRSEGTLPSHRSPFQRFHSTGTSLSARRGGDRFALSGSRLWELPALSRDLAHQAQPRLGAAQ